MQAHPVDSYRLQWNPQHNRGRIEIIPFNGQPIPLAVDSAAEFNAICNVLRESPVYIFPDGTLSTHWERVDE